MEVLFTVVLNAFLRLQLGLAILKYGVEHDPDYAFEFERFRACACRRKVFKGHEPINLGARALTE